MTDRYGDPSYDGDSDPYADEPEELDENGEPLSRLTPTAREHLASARAKLAATKAKP